MTRTFGIRTLLAVSGALALLLAALAVVQYRWSTRVAAADAQREKEHLDSSASLFATEFNTLAGQAADYLQNDAWAAFRSGDRLAPPPKWITEIYHLDLSENAPARARRLNSGASSKTPPCPRGSIFPAASPMRLN